MRMSDAHISPWQKSELRKNRPSAATEDGEKDRGNGETAAKDIPQGLKPSLYFEAFAARLKPCPYYKAQPVSSFFATCKAALLLQLPSARLKRLRKKGEYGANSGTIFPQGLKPSLYFGAFAARLKSCPFTKLHPYRVFPQPVKSCPVTKPASHRVFPEPAMGRNGTGAAL
jgi:hypothetical protein